MHTSRSPTELRNARGFFDVLRVLHSDLAAISIEYRAGGSLTDLRISLDSLRYHCTITLERNLGVANMTLQTADSRKSLGGTPRTHRVTHSVSPPYFNREIRVRMRVKDISENVQMT